MTTIDHTIYKLKANMQIKNNNNIRISKLYPKHIRMGAYEGGRNRNRDQVCSGKQQDRRGALN